MEATSIIARQPSRPKREIGMNVHLFGPESWRLYHMFADSLTTQRGKAALLRWLQRQAKTKGCVHCRKSFQKIVEKYLPRLQAAAITPQQQIRDTLDDNYGKPKCLDGIECLSRVLYDIHNTVNDKLSFQTFERNMEEALDKAEATMALPSTFRRQFMRLVLETGGYRGTRPTFETHWKKNIAFQLSRDFTKYFNPTSIFSMLRIEAYALQDSRFEPFVESLADLREILEDIPAFMDAFPGFTKSLGKLYDVLGTMTPGTKAPIPALCKADVACCASLVLVTLITKELQLQDKITTKTKSEERQRLIRQEIDVTSRFCASSCAKNRTCL